MKAKRIVIAGQLPPPVGGQAVMIGRLVAQMKMRPNVRAEHLPFYFTRTTSDARRFNLGKVVELIAVLVRLVRLRMEGQIDLLIYPTGGPQLMPVLRDIVLLPFIHLASRRVVIHFHAAGIAEKWEGLPAAIRWALRLCHRPVRGAIVQTQFGRRDPECLGIAEIRIVPHAVEDHRGAQPRGWGDPLRAISLLYVGHLCPDKGTPALIQVVARLREMGLPVELSLVGECLAPWSEQDLRQAVMDHKLERVVNCPGPLRGSPKWDSYAAADLFVFPSLAPYESFGLVMVEAMMWALPIVATDWRGNREVLGEDFGGICFEATPLADRLLGALSAAIAQRAEWPRWGEANRRIFESRYREEKFGERLPEAVEGLSG